MCLYDRLSGYWGLLNVPDLHGISFETPLSSERRVSVDSACDVCY